MSQLETTWGDPDMAASDGGRGGKIRRFRLSAAGAQDRTTNSGGIERIAILDQKPIKVSQHYFNPKNGAVTKGYFRCSMEIHKACPACDEFAKNGKDNSRCSEAKTRYAFNVWVYDTDPQGNLLTDPQGNVSGAVYLYQTSDTSQISRAQTDWGDIRQHDFVVTPDGDLAFQQMFLSIQPKSAFLTAPNRVKLVEQYKAEVYAVADIVGKDWKPEELAAKLYGGPDASGYQSPATPAEAARAALNVPTDDVLRELGEDLVGEAPAVSAAPVNPTEGLAAQEGFMDLDAMLNTL